MCAAVTALAAEPPADAARPTAAPAAQPAATPAEPPAAAPAPPPAPAPLGPPTYTKDGADTCRNCHDEEDPKVQVLFKTKHSVKADPNSPMHVQDICAFSFAEAREQLRGASMRGLWARPRG